MEKKTPHPRQAYVLMTPAGEEAKVKDLPHTYHRVGRSNPCKYHTLSDLVEVLSNRAGLSHTDWVKAFEAGVTMIGFYIVKKETQFSLETTPLLKFCKTSSEEPDLDITVPESVNL